MTTEPLATDAKRTIAFAVVILLVLGTVFGLAGTDLILPAIPSFPALFDSTAATGQWVIAGYVGGYAFGLFLFGWLADHVARSRLIIASALAFTALSAAIALAETPTVILALRALQGVSAAAPAVFAPVVIKALFDERGAMRALGVLGSVEALAPAFAPVFGLWLFALGGWQAVFFTLTGAAALLAIAALTLAPAIPSRQPSVSGANSRTASYARLLRDPHFMRHGFAQAATIGGLLVFVFSAPVVITSALGGTPGDFITMQILGIAGFMVAANLSGALAERFGAERLIAAGTWLALLFAAILSIAGFAGFGSPALVIALFLPVNVGLGLRGPPGFYLAITAAQDAGDRASSLVILMAMAIAAGGGALLAPWAESGLAAPAVASTAIFAVASAVFAWRPKQPAA